MAKALIASGQGHLFRSWPLPGEPRPAHYRPYDGLAPRHSMTSPALIQQAHDVACSQPQLACMQAGCVRMSMRDHTA